MDSLKKTVVVLMLVLAAVPAFAADLVSVSTHVSQTAVSPGGTNHGDILISNNTLSDVRFRMEVRVVYADGTVQYLTGLTDSGTLRAGEGFVQSILFIIPADAAPGVATFIADVSASSGGLQEQETSSATFTVLPL